MLRNILRLRPAIGSELYSERGYPSLRQAVSLYVPSPRLSDSARRRHSSQCFPLHVNLLVSPRQWFCFRSFVSNLSSFLTHEPSEKRTPGDLFMHTSHLPPILYTLFILFFFFFPGILSASMTPASATHISLGFVAVSVSVPRKIQQTLVGLTLVSG